MSTDNKVATTRTTNPGGSNMNPDGSKSDANTKDTTGPCTTIVPLTGTKGAMESVEEEASTGLGDDAACYMLYVGGHNDLVAGVPIDEDDALPDTARVLASEFLCDIHKNGSDPVVCTRDIMRNPNGAKKPGQKQEKKKRALQALMGVHTLEHFNCIPEKMATPFRTGGSIASGGIALGLNNINTGSCPAVSGGVNIEQPSASSGGDNMLTTDVGASAVSGVVNIEQPSASSGGDNMLTTDVGASGGKIVSGSRVGSVSSGGTLTSGSVASLSGGVFGEERSAVLSGGVADQGALGEEMGSDWNVGMVDPEVMAGCSPVSNSGSSFGSSASMDNSLRRSYGSDMALPAQPTPKELELSQLLDDARTQIFTTLDTHEQQVATITGQLTTSRAELTVARSELTVALAELHDKSVTEGEHQKKIIGIKLKSATEAAEAVHTAAMKAAEAAHTAAMEATTAAHNTDHAASLANIQALTDAVCGERKEVTVRDDTIKALEASLVDARAGLDTMTARFNEAELQVQNAAEQLDVEKQHKKRYKSMFVAKTKENAALKDQIEVYHARAAVTTKARITAMVDAAKDQETFSRTASSPANQWNVASQNSKRRGSSCPASPLTGVSERFESGGDAYAPRTPAASEVDSGLGEFRDSARAGGRRSAVTEPASPLPRMASLPLSSGLEGPGLEVARNGGRRFSAAAAEPASPLPRPAASPLDSGLHPTQLPFARSGSSYPAAGYPSAAGAKGGAKGNGGAPREPLAPVDDNVEQA